MLHKNIWGKWLGLKVQLMIIYNTAYVSLNAVYEVYVICCLKKKQKEGSEKLVPFVSDNYGVVKLEYLAQKMFIIEL